jgi:hypothetical protein
MEDRTLLNNYFAASADALIADIDLANAAGGTNTITLIAPAASPYTLTAVNNGNFSDGPTGLPVIAAGTTLTLMGNGNTIERSTDATTPAFRLFDIAAGASLTLQDLTLQNGLASGGGVWAKGGAIFSRGTLTLDGVTVRNNTAQGFQGTDGLNDTGAGARVGGDGTSGGDA